MPDARVPETSTSSKASLTSSGGDFGEGGVTAATPRTYAGRVDRAKTSKASLSSSGGYFGEVTAATPRTYAGRLGRAQGSKMSTSSKDSRPPPELEDAGVGGAFARLSEESELPEASIKEGLRLLEERHGFLAPGRGELSRR